MWSPDVTDIEIELQVVLNYSKSFYSKPFVDFIEKARILRGQLETEYVSHEIKKK